MKKNLEITTNIFFIIIYSIIYAVGIRWFIEPAALLTTGVAGISQIVTLLSGINYGLIYILLNIPGIYVGFRYIGGRFTIYSLISVLVVSIVTSYLPVMGISDDIIVNAIFGGILMGFSIGKMLEMGGSCGGTDFFAMYLLKYKNVDFQRVNFILNIGIIIAGVLALIFKFGISASITLGLYTTISLYIRNSVLGEVFTNTQTVTLFIVGNQLEDVSTYINSTLHRGTTIINDVEGGYTHNKKQMIMATLNQYEYSLFIEEIGGINPNIFINIVDTKRIIGNYQLTKGD